MRLLFVHDNPFVEWGGEVYSQGSISSRTWRCFLPHVEELVVGARGVEGSAADVEGLNTASAPRVSFSLTPRLPVSRVLPGWRQTHEMLLHEVSRADAVVVRLPSLFGLLAGNLALKQGKPLGCEVVGCVFDAYWNYGTLPGKLLAYPTFWRIRRLIGKIGFGVYVTEAFLQKRYPCGGRSEGVSDVELSEPGEGVLAQRLSRIGAGVGSEVYEVGLVGSFKHRYKGWDTAIRAIGRVAAKQPVRLRLLGAGDPARIAEYAQQVGVDAPVVCDGVLPAGEAVLDWLARLDCYIQPSLTEGLPRSVIEAMSRGLPCLATSVGEIPELLDAECLLQPHDDVRLGALLTRLIEEPSWASAQAERNFEKAKGFYASRLEPRREQLWGEFVAQARTGQIKAGG
jgi:glycosyltransferase involved in cell wall biosynthesis